MKKQISLLIALAMMLSLAAACGTGDTTTPTTTSPPATTAAAGTTAAATTAATVATAPDGVTTGGTMVMSLGAEPVNLNPNGNYDANLGWIAQNLFNRLIKMNSMQQILPDLAASYEVSDDGLSYAFHLRGGVQFHDGAAMTSDDVKFTFEYIKEKQTHKGYIMDKVESITCPDELTVVFNMSAVDASFLHNMADQGTYVLPRHVYEGKDWMGADSLQTPVGTGPFVYDSWDKGTRMSLKRNDNFFLGKELPYLDRIIFAFVADGTVAKTAFLDGEYDIMGVFASTDFNELRNHGSIDMEVNIYPSRFIVEFNMAAAPFDNVDVRQAIAYGIDNQELMTMALKEVGLEAKHFLSPLFDWAIDTGVTVPGFDPDKAKTLLEGSGLTTDANGNYMSITVDTMNYAPFPDVAQVFKSQMAKIGVDVTINMLEYASFDEKVVQNKNFQIGITSDYQGPEVSAISNSLSSTGYLNCMGYSNPEVDRLLGEAVNLASFEERAPLYKQVQKHMQTDLPYYIFSEWIGYYPHWDYVKNHPGNASVRDLCGSGEFTYVWLDN